MKLKFIFLIKFIGIALITNCYGQDYSLEWGMESNASGMLPNRIIGVHNGSIYVLKDKWSSAGVEHYLTVEKYSGNDLHLIYSSELKMPDNEEGKETSFSTICLIKGKLFLITQHGKEKLNVNVGKRGTVYSCYATPINDKGIVDKKATLIYQDEQHVNLSEVKICRFVLSKDKEKLFMYSGNLVDTKLNGKIIDSDLNTTDVSLELPFENSYSISSFIFNNDHIYFLGKELLPPSEWFNKEEEKYKISVLDYDLKNRKHKATVLKVIDQPITGIEMEMKNNALLITGYYTNPKSEKKSKGGIFLFKLNAGTHEVVTNFKNEIDDNSILKLNAEKSKPNPISELRKKNIIELPEGGYIISSEQSDGSNYNYIYVQFIGKNGVLESSAVIPKKQGGMMPESYSFLQFFKNNTLYIVFNDNEKNLNLEDPYKLKGGIANVNSSIPVIVAVAKTGEWKKKKLLENNKIETNIYPGISELVKPNQLFTITQKGKKIKFVIFNF